MMARWKQLADKVDALSQRERLLVLLGLLAVVVAVTNGMLLDPVSRQAKTLAGEVAANQMQVAALKQQVSVLDHTALVDPDLQNKNRLAEINRQLQQTGESLNGMQQRLVSPDRMARLLEDILKENGQLQLVSLKTLAPSGAAAPGQVAASATASAAEPPVYRHGVELNVRGRYMDLMNYLAALEKLRWHMLWGNISLTADAYPQSTLTVTIYTLSLDEAWLSI